MKESEIYGHFFQVIEQPSDFYGNIIEIDLIRTSGNDGCPGIENHSLNLLSVRTVQKKINVSLSLVPVYIREGL